MNSSDVIKVYLSERYKTTPSKAATLGVWLKRKGDYAVELGTNQNFRRNFPPGEATKLLLKDFAIFVNGRYGWKLVKAENPVIYDDRVGDSWVRVKVTFVDAKK